MMRSVVFLSLLFLSASGVGVLSHFSESALGTPRLAAEGQASAGVQTEPFTINVPDDVLVDLQQRLARTRMPDEPDGVGWMLGTNRAYLKQLVDYWRDEFDWRRKSAGSTGSSSSRPRSTASPSISYIVVRGFCCAGCNTVH